MRIPIAVAIVAAVALSEEACRLIVPLDSPVELQFRQRDRAEILAQAGRHGEALEALEAIGILPGS